MMTKNGMLFSIAVLFFGSNSSYAEDVCGVVTQVNSNCFTPSGADCDYAITPGNCSTLIDLVSGNATIAQLLKDNVNRNCIVSIGYDEGGDTVALEIQPVTTCN
jgi:hypothetical protein